MKTKHTPGPWRVRYIADGEPSRGFFVEAPRINPKHGYDIEILCEDGNYPDDMREADAHLVAAAPDLLAVAKLSEKFYRDELEAIGDCEHAVNICCCEIKRELEDLQAVISKAEGK